MKKINDKIENIKKLFNELDAIEQNVLLKELSISCSSSKDIALFCQKHQQRFGTNVEFNIQTTGAGQNVIITVTVKTFYGKFIGTGNNQKMAKLNAIMKAEEKFKTLKN